MTGLQTYVASSNARSRVYFRESRGRLRKFVGSTLATYRAMIFELGIDEAMQTCDIKAT